MIYSSLRAGRASLRIGEEEEEEEEERGFLPMCSEGQGRSFAVLEKARLSTGSPTCGPTRLPAGLSGTTRRRTSRGAMGMTWMWASCPMLESPLKGMSECLHVPDPNPNLQARFNERYVKMMYADNAAVGLSVESK
jgi:hypothetical protein